MTRKWIGVAAAVVLLPLSMASTCNSEPLANIYYEQIGACNGFTGPNGVGQTPPSGVAFVVFRIKTVKNTSTGAKDFAFDPSKLYTNNPDGTKQFAKGYYTLGWAHPRAVENRTVKAGATEVFNGTVTTEYRAGDSGVNAAEIVKNIAINLLYEPQAGTQGTFMTKDNSSQTSWASTNDCKDIERNSPNP